MSKKYILLGADNIGSNITIQIMSSSKPAFAAMNSEYMSAMDDDMDIDEKDISYYAAFIHKVNCDFLYWRIVEQDITDMNYAVLCADNVSSDIQIRLYENRTEAYSRMKTEFNDLCNGNNAKNASITEDGASIQMQSGDYFYWNVKELPPVQGQKDIVQQYCFSHPNSKQIDCIRQTGISESVVSKYWPEETSWGKSFDMVEEYFNANPHATQKDCARATGLSKAIVCSCWRKTSMYKKIQHEIEQYYKTNPKSSYIDCAKDTGHRLYYVKRFWPGTVKKPKRIVIKKSSLITLKISGCQECYKLYKTKAKVWDLKSEHAVYGLGCRTLKQLKTELLQDYNDGIIEDISVA